MMVLLKKGTMTMRIWHQSERWSVVEEVPEVHCYYEDIIVKNNLENAIIDICAQEDDDAAYMAVEAWYYQLCFEDEEMAPFDLRKDLIFKAIKDCLNRNKSKLLTTTKWVDTLNSSFGAKNLYDHIKERCFS